MKPTLAVKGWCPGAYRPMMSGDGLIVRIRPYCARLETAQVLGLCALAQDYGNGILDLTNRANIQIRGVTEARLDALLASLSELRVLDETPELESRRNILVTPFWADGDDTQKLFNDLMSFLPQLPDLPAKFGIGVDVGTAPVLGHASADIRIERAPSGLIIRADGASLGRQVSKKYALSAVLEMMDWFAANRVLEERRMAHVLTRCELPAEWTVEAPLATASVPDPGRHRLGLLVGAAFGQIDAAALTGYIQDTGASAMRVTPWRMFLLEGAAQVASETFISRPGDPLLHIDACPGAPHCASATVATRNLARQLAGQVTGSLHVSGCTKGCARKAPAATTLVGNQGRFDLVSKGHAWDAPKKTGLRPEDLCAQLTGHT